MSHSTHTPGGPATLLIDIATREVVCLAPGDALGMAAHLMAERKISSVVVSDAAGRPVGIVTERSILMAMHAGRAPETPLREIMSSPVVTVPASITYLDAYQSCLREGIRHLVVTDEQQRLLGVVSETDFRLHINLSALAGHRQVSAAMSRSVFSLPPTAGLETALELMRSHRNTCVVVIEDEIPVGLVTERDIVRLYSAAPADTALTLREVMTSPAQTIPLDSTINEAAERMLATRVRHLVVTDAAHRLAGLLNEHDLTHTLSLSLIDDKLIAEGALLHTLINTIPDMIWLKNADGVYLACNPRFELFFGAAEKDIVGKTDYDFVNVELADFFREHDRLAMKADGPSINEEWVTFASDGHRERLETIKTPMRDSQGRLIGVLGVARDITDRKRIEDALYFISQKGWKEGTESFLDALARHLGEALEVDYVVIDRLTDDPDYAETLAFYARGEILPNLRYRLTGTPCESVMGRDYCCFPEKVRQHFPADELLARMGVESYAGIPLWDSGGHAIGLISVMDDKPLTNGVLVSQLLKVVATRVAAELERDAADRVLRQRELEFRTLAENMPDNMVRYDLAGRVRYMNPAFLASVAPQIRPAIGLTLIEAHPQLPVALELHRTLEQVIASGAPAEREVILARGDGELRNHHIRFVAERNSDGDIVGALAIGRDITERKRFEKHLAEREELFHTVFNQAPNGIELIDPESLRFIEVNPAACKMLGHPHEELLALRLTDTQAELDEAALRQAIERIAAQPDGLTFENRHRTRGGETLDVEVSARILEFPDKRLLVGMWRDISEHKRAEAALRVTASVFETSQEAIVITDAGNRIIDVNPAFSHITGYSRTEVLGKNPGLLSSGRQDAAFYAQMWDTLRTEKSWRGEIWNRRKSGEIFAELLSVSAICDDEGRVQRHVGVFSDISHLKAHEAELSRVANFDALTGIPNRRLLADRLNQAIVHAQRSGKTLAVCYLDLDGFKRVNDELGHEAGDQLLIDITHRLQDALRAGDTLARLGGDEFVLLFNDLPHEQECFQILERSLETIARPVSLNGNEARVSASIGVTFYPADPEDGDTLLRHADQAMYVAKQTGKNRYHPYDRIHDQRIRSLHESRERISRGLHDGEFELYYQPKIALRSGELVGAEALIRWRRPDAGLLLPAEFLPLIDDSRLEIELGEWVLDNALNQLDAWCATGLTLELSINISAHHLQSPEFVAALSERLARHPGLPAHCLQIEVLETAALEDIVQSSRTIDACLQLGVGVALDDFGTGYSSLAYLSKLSADTLKIDQSFVRGMLADEGDRAIVQGIIALANTFGRKTVAEGMEDAALIQPLIEAGCQYGQGNSIARPMPADDFMNWVAERQHTAHHA